MCDCGSVIAAGMIFYAMVAFMGSHGISHISQCYLNLNGAFCSALDMNRCRADHCSFDVGSCF